ncbi:MAG: sulfotransferase family 2 domain-containing protein, partial [Leptolyngbya sp. SIO3F4]|nr:sulfotransferase family 2 domain-containing protein [Leptolyngbya sp. SIO3F4]
MEELNSDVDQRLIIFTHLPKTAGTTLKHITQRQYLPNEIFEFYSLTRQPSKGINVFESLAEHRSNKLKFVTGHIGFGLHRLTPRPCTYITILRDPIRRVISFYYYLLRNNPNHADLKDCKSLEDFIQRANIAKNGMTQYLSNAKLKSQLNYKGGRRKDEQYYCTKETLEEAKKNLKENFSVIGIMEEFDKVLVLLKRQLGWQIYPYLKANVAKKKTPREDLSDKAMHLLEIHSKYDIELYQYARQLFYEMIEHKGNSFS